MSHLQGALKHYETAEEALERQRRAPAPVDVRALRKAQRRVDSELYGVGNLLARCRAARDADPELEDLLVTAQATVILRRRELTWAGPPPPAVESRLGYLDALCDDVHARLEELRGHLGTAQSLGSAQDALARAVAWVEELDHALTLLRGAELDLAGATGETRRAAQNETLSRVFNVRDVFKGLSVGAFVGVGQVAEWHDRAKIARFFLSERANELREGL